MSKATRGVVAALAVAALAGFVCGCGLFKGQQKDDPFGEAERTSSARPEAAATAPQPAESPSYESPPTESQTPAETYVEPSRPWGAETRDNLGTP